MEKEETDCLWRIEADDNDWAKFDTEQLLLYFVSTEIVSGLFIIRLVLNFVCWREITKRLKVRKVKLFLSFSAKLTRFMYFAFCVNGCQDYDEVIYLRSPLGKLNRLVSQDLFFELVKRFRLLIRVIICSCDKGLGFVLILKFFLFWWQSLSA